MFRKTCLTNEERKLARDTFVSDLIFRYIEAANQSSARTRGIIVTIVVASTIGFSASFSSVISDWSGERLLKARDALACVVDHRCSDPAEIRRNKDCCSTSCRQTPYRRKADQCVTATEAYIFDKHFVDEEDIRTEVEWLTRGVIDNINFVRIPFLGAVFDINAIGIMFSIAFICLMLWLRFALIREKDNIKQCFDVARAFDCQEQAYGLVAAHQVLLVPNPLDPRRPDRGIVTRFANYLPQSVVVLPALVTSTICFCDLMSLDQGLQLSGTWTMSSSLVTFGSALALWAMALVCFVHLQNIRSTWNEVAESILKDHP